MHLPSQGQEARKQVSSLFDQNESSAAEAGCGPDSGGNSSARLSYSSAARWCFSGLSAWESERGSRIGSEDVGDCAEGCAHADSWASHPSGPSSDVNVSFWLVYLDILGHFVNIFLCCAKPLQSYSALRYPHGL